MPLPPFSQGLLSGPPLGGNAQARSCLFLKCYNQFAAKAGKIIDHPPPHQIAIAQGRKVYPDATGVFNIVLDGYRARGLVPPTCRRMAIPRS